MSEHLVLDRWVGLVGPIKELSAQYGLELLAMEQPSQDPEVMEQAFQAAKLFGSPLSTAAPAGKPATKSRYGQHRVAHQLSKQRRTTA